MFTPRSPHTTPKTSIDSKALPTKLSAIILSLETKLELLANEEDKALLAEKVGAKRTHLKIVFAGKYQPLERAINTLETIKKNQPISLDDYLHLHQMLTANDLKDPSIADYGQILSEEKNGTRYDCLMNILCNGEISTRSRLRDTQTTMQYRALGTSSADIAARIAQHILTLAQIEKAKTLLSQIQKKETVSSDEKIFLLDKLHKFAYKPHHKVLIDVAIDTYPHITTKLDLKTAPA